MGLEAQEVAGQATEWTWAMGAAPQRQQWGARTLTGGHRDWPVVLTFPYLLKRFFRSVALVVEDSPLTQKLRPQLLRPASQEFSIKNNPQRL